MRIVVNMVYLLLNMFERFSDLYDERVDTYRQERKKTEKLLSDLLPKQIIKQMKKVTQISLPYFVFV